MTREEIMSHLVEVMQETFELDPADLTPEADLRDTLGLDSIDAVDMAVKIQQFTNRKPSFDELRQLTTLSDVVDLVERHLAEAETKENSRSFG